MTRIGFSAVRVLGGSIAIVFSLSAVVPAEVLPSVPKYASLDESRKVFVDTVKPVLMKHCNACHSGGTIEGDLDLTALDPDTEAGSGGGRWAMLKKRVALREMPPADRPKLSDAEVAAVTDWIAGELKRSGRHFSTRAEYHNGNKVPHDKLFDPKFKAKFDSPGGLRRISPEIYASSFITAGGVLAQPFTQANGFLFRDMGAPKLDEPTTVLLIRNAFQIAAGTTSFTLKDGKKTFGGHMPREFAPLFDESKPPTDAEIAAAIGVQFSGVLKRAPTDQEKLHFVELYRKNHADAGPITGSRATLAAVYLLPEVIYRWELASGQPDADGKIRLSPRVIAYAISYGLTDGPPTHLLDAAAKGELDTREGVEAHVLRMVSDVKVRNRRIMRFFQEYFGYMNAKEVFQDEKSFYEHDAGQLIADTTRLIEYILEKDQNVFVELMTTNKAFVGQHPQNVKQQRAAVIAKARAKYDEELKKGKFTEESKPFKVDRRWIPGRSTYEAYNLDDFPDELPVDLPKDQRAGILTQPSWLAANAKTDENHAIFRGKWVREKLLGGVVPDLPITVDAQLPNAPHHGLRERMKVTEAAYCWKCHTLMNPLGLTFEAYDCFGRFRKEEPVLDVEATEKNVDNKGKSLGNVMKSIAVDSSGKINDFGDPSAEGEVGNAVEMLHRIAKSERAEQVFIRHVFRYFTGRNENLGDGPSLRYAQMRYRESGGSMKALVAAIMASDSFLYRVPSANDQ